ncbi:hypothetical protein N7499_003304 [Penicillium canescens]|uniref:Uncharacterized protein n=1 Tax=Penicillium canescens TaxID=5083 RepID=A0AAD6I6B7_PENCN|nr:uncharacterized protein N7446_014074 [Penicillium canescens]KAJ6018468.1 hypothetical protein N7522_001932 [Penicillium canescens]KAJ6034109.1 hypothetical protein N7460_009926 [Penicillium canescens]KAJ6039326.1 hypothetical protein N7446_014074 [Penicillium canescens]KAJ6066164.1 hypothetical protein N7444_000293 [Penicillium canescens]KAJ6091153.1 hypothetical protein N7499_003304 [Penicillium canescens]
MLSPQQQLQLQQQRELQARMLRMKAMFARQQQERSPQKNSHVPIPAEINLTSAFERSSDADLAITHPTDNGFIGSPPAYLTTYETACRTGNLSIVQAFISSEPRSPAFLHHGLTLALESGHAEMAHYLLSSGAPIIRHTPAQILYAPAHLQISLFEVLAQYGWTPNIPGNYGADLLPKVVTNPPLLHWFLAHGTNPNLGAQQNSNFDESEPDPHSCVALEAAAARGEVDAVRMLLNAGADIRYGTPLHYAAGAVSPGGAPEGPMNKEFDASRIPIMALLVDRGADVNQSGKSRLVAHHPIMYAVMAGAVERVRWLLGQGADPEARGAWGSAADYVDAIGSDEMRRVIQEGIMAKQRA